MRLSFLNILAAAAIAVPAVFASPANAQTKIVIGYTPNAEAASVYVAKEKGFFEKHGLNAEPVPVAINSTLPAALMSELGQFRRHHRACVPPGRGQRPRSRRPFPACR